METVAMKVATAVAVFLLLTASALIQAPSPSEPAVQALLQQLVNNHGIKGIVVGLG
jgi:hypothetical protein